MIFLIIIVLLLVAMAVFFAVAQQVGTKASGNRLQVIQSSPQYKNGRFENVIETKLDLSFRTMFKTLYDMMNGKEGRVPSKPIHTKKFDKEIFNGLGNGSTAAIAWFGHSTVLIKIHGKVFLTDPVIVGKRASMLSSVGPKRFDYTHPLDLDELPVIDATLLSHDHYDHLDYPTILKIKKIVKHFIVPLGVGAHLEKWGVPPSQVQEFDWWEQFAFGPDIKLTCVPSRHFSGRTPAGRDRTLWCSWIIKGMVQQIYFGADSGYSPSFKKIGDRYGPFDICLLECGAYSKYWPHIHMMP